MNDEYIMDIKDIKNVEELNDSAVTTYCNDNLNNSNPILVRCINGIPIFNILAPPINIYAGILYSYIESHIANKSLNDVIKK